MKKTRDLMILLGVYVLAFVASFFACIWIKSTILKFFLFDVIATIIVYIFSVLFHNSSVYDAYWSVTPLVMILWLFIVEKAWSIPHIIFLAVFLLWAIRLTKNWMEVFTDFSYEDWRYRKYREETPRHFWFFVNFFGIHMVPTLIVFAGMLPLFELAKLHLNWMILPGVLIMLFGISMEFFADRQMHEFLSSKKKGTVCNLGLWKYSRHPNYLGEISFWLGVFITMLPFSLSHWYYVIGFVLVAVLFNVVSIPLMEKRQLSRRPEYKEYQKVTSRLLLRPQKDSYEKSGMASV
ncbi:MAG: DUF1295 domain-containing protein [Lachnospiraceae bacterium]|nr:DUF1295 domain-containing protein [Lachnospiraceae bacterium]